MIGKPRRIGEEEERDHFDPTSELFGKPLEVLDSTRMITAPYFVFGCDPRAVSYADHAFNAYDLFRMVDTLMADESPDLEFYVADFPMHVNIYRNLMEEQLDYPSNRRASPSELMIVAKEQARLIGIRDAMFLEAIQDHIATTKTGVFQPLECAAEFEEDPFIREEMAAWGDTMRALGEFSGSDPKLSRSLRVRPVNLMSDVADGHPAATQLFEKLSALTRANKELILKKLDCVPVPIIVSTFKMKKKAVVRLVNSGLHLEDDGFWNELNTLFQYVDFETVTTFLSGPKYGHEGERPYDELAIYIYENFGEELGIKARPEFRYPDAGLDGVNPYRKLHGEVDTLKADVFSPARSFSPGREVENINFIDGQYWPILRRFIDKLSQRQDLSPAVREHMLNVEVKKFVMESLSTVAGIYKTANYVFDYTGLAQKARENTQNGVDFACFAAEVVESMRDDSHGDMKNGAFAWHPIVANFSNMVKQLAVIVDGRKVYFDYESANKKHLGGMKVEDFIRTKSGGCIPEILRTEDWLKMHADLHREREAS